MLFLLPFPLLSWNNYFFNPSGNRGTLPPNPTVTDSKFLISSNTFLWYGVFNLFVFWSVESFLIYIWIKQFQNTIHWRLQMTRNNKTASKKQQGQIITLRASITVFEILNLLKSISFKSETLYNKHFTCKNYFSIC